MYRPLLLPQPDALNAMLRAVIAIFFAVYTILSISYAQLPVSPNLPEAPNTGTVKGILLDAITGEPVGYASVRIVDANNNLLAGELSKDDGTFLFRNIPFGNNYSLMASFLGYKEAASQPFSLSKETPVIDLAAINLGSDAQLLDELEVVGQTATTQIGIERKVYNVDKDLMSRGGSIQDVLKNVPSVDVNSENKVTLRGNENVKILINGESSGLTASESFLQQLPANSVDRIEVITSPSARFDPEGTSGIINIVLKENKSRGVSGTVNAGYGYGNRHKAEAGISLNYLSPKWSLNSGLSYRYSPSKYGGTSDRYNLLNDSLYRVVQTDDGNEEEQSFLVRFGIDFNPNKQNAFGFSYLSNISVEDQVSIVRYAIYNSTLADPLTKVRATSRFEPYTYRGDIRAYYRLNFRKQGANLRINGSYSLNTNLPDNDYEEYLTDDNFDRVAPSFLFERTRQDNRTNTLNASADLVLPVSDKMMIEAGYKGTLNKRDNDFRGELFDMPAELWENDTTRTNRFLLDEHIESLYGTYQHSLGNFTYKVGLRMEYTWMNSRLSTTGENFVNNYFGIYPSINLNYKLPKDQTLSLGFSRRVQRPGMWALNPFTNYSDPLNLRRGNPFLQPEFINATEAGYTRYWSKGTFNTSVYYRFSTDVLNRVRTINDENVSLVTWGNVDKNHSWGIELLGDYRPFKWWGLSANANLFQTKTVGKVDGLDLNNDNFSWNARMTSTFSFWKSADFQVSARYRAKFESAQFIIKPFTNVDVAIKKSFLKDNTATITLRASDIFNTLSFALESKEANVVQTMERKWESRQVWLTFAYNFGKLSQAQKRQQPMMNDGGGGMDMMGP
jgi:iron complex outermembrane recepter protein